MVRPRVDAAKDCKTVLSSVAASVATSSLEVLHLRGITAGKLTDRSSAIVPGLDDFCSVLSAGCGKLAAVVFGIMCAKKL